MRVLIIGASGFIGHYLRRRLAQNSNFEVTSTYNARAPEDTDNSWYSLDITDYHRLQQTFQEVRPDVVVLLAAIADVKTAEMGQTNATRVNVEGARQVARICTRHNAILIFLSSEYVFRGDRGNYKEDDEPDPNTHYGRTKWQAELAVADEASRWSIIRTSVVYGWPITGRRNLATVILDQLKSGETYEGDTGTYKAAAELDNVIQVYTDIPVANNFHVKLGLQRVTLTSLESLNSGSEYPDADLFGATIGWGYSGDIPYGNNLYYKAEVTYTNFETYEDSSSGNSTGNKVSADLEDTAAKLSIGYKF